MKWSKTRWNICTILFLHLFLNNSLLCGGLASPRFEGPRKTSQMFGAKNLFSSFFSPVFWRSVCASSFSFKKRMCHVNGEKLSWSNYFWRHSYQQKNILKLPIKSSNFFLSFYSAMCARMWLVLWTALRRHFLCD